MIFINKLSHLLNYIDSTFQIINEFYSFLYRSKMNGTLASKIEFVELCDIFEKIFDTKKSQISRKADILEQFFEKCRNMGRELKTEYPDMVKF